MNRDDEIRDLSASVRSIVLLIAASFVAFTVLLFAVPVVENEVPPWVIHVVTVVVFLSGFGAGWWYRGWTGRPSG